MSDETAYPYFAIVTFGTPTLGERRSYYRSLARAIEDASTLRGGSLTDVRVLGCRTRAEALAASIADDDKPVLWSR